MANKTLQAIADRHSCRSFSLKKVPSSKLNVILEAGVQAPSGMNRQSCNILLIKNKATLNKIRNALQEKYSRECLYGAQTLAIVYGLKDEPLVVQDGSCILENIFIAASSLKVATCWINQLNDLLSDPNYLSLRMKLCIPSEYRVIGSAAIGYPNDDYKYRDIEHKKDYIRII